MAYRSRLVMNKNLIIEEIRRRPILWSQKNVATDLKSVRLQAWEDVGASCGLSILRTKKLWKNLRDQFRREYYRSVNEGYRIRWRYYRSMSFLLPQLEFEYEVLHKKFEIKDDRVEKDSEILRNPIKEEILDTEECCLEDEVHRDNIRYSPLTVNVDNIEEATSSKPLHLDKKSTIKIKNETNNNENEHLHKRVKLNQDGNKESAELQFFKSLLPYMESFELIDKLEIRNKIQTLILEKYKELQNL